MVISDYTLITSMTFSVQVIPNYLYNDIIVFRCAVKSKGWCNLQLQESFDYAKVESFNYYWIISMWPQVPPEGLWLLFFKKIERINDHKLVDEISHFEADQTSVGRCLGVQAISSTSPAHDDDVVVSVNEQRRPRACSACSIFLLSLCKSLINSNKNQA